jgi:hypothetical protein
MKMKISYDYLLEILRSFYNQCFFKFLLEKLSRRQVHLLASKVLHTEADPTQLNRIELLDLIIKLSVGVF